jgi:hypothetical protein
MDQIAPYFEHFMQFFNSLPLLTRGAVTLLFCLGFIVHAFAFNEKSAHDGPSIFTTCGIFFTFVGIAEGLIGFNPKDIEASIPQLLGGLQTAFVASVVGIFIALTIKLRVILFGLPERDARSPTEGASVDDLHNQMTAVHQALVGDDDSTLLSQMKLMRQDTNDGLTKLHKSQSEFMEKMADNNSKALIQALQEVIRDFNTKLSEQFGENFKQLNAAVGKLLTWQEQYRVQLIELVEQQTATSQNMKVASENYANLVGKAEAFSTIATQLATILTELGVQRGQIEQSLKSLGQLLTTASESLPQVQNKIMDLTQQMTFGVKSNQEEITKAIRDGSIVLQGTVGDMRKELVEATQATHQQISAHAKNLSDGVQNSQTEMINAIKNSSTALQQSVIDVKKVLLEATQSANQELNAHVKHISEETSKEVVKLDQALERELTKAITTMGSQLTSLSKQFVDDYTPLTERLRDLLRSVGAK